MKLLVALAAVLVVGCGLGLGIGLGKQTLVSQCLGDAGADPTACPACAQDGDCVVLTNPCHPTAACVPRAGNWAVNMIGCNLSYEAPPADSCVCFRGVCQVQPTR